MSRSDRYFPCGCGDTGNYESSEFLEVQGIPFCDECAWKIKKLAGQLEDFGIKLEDLT